MNEQGYINDCNKTIRDHEDEIETLTLKCSHGGGSYNELISYRIGHLRTQIHVIKLKRNKQIRRFYTYYNKN
jgi:hypothetical protein